MKKLLLFAMGAMVSMASFAQDEDVTNYIQNAGFDEDLTWQANGSTKEIIDKTNVLSDRSIAGIAADSSVYATVNPSTPKSRSDGRTLEATNGFIGRVQGWTIETNQTFPKCEWVYFGTLPYALADQAIPVADDGNTYITVPEKPEVANGDDNTGFVYMRAGWGGKAIYKQTVKLPCAKYRLEYWSININPSGTNGKNLSKVTCRKDSWPDETGFNATEWTLHAIEFTPTAEFTMEFGFESSGGSGSNPFLCIDGIKLYKIDEADVDELVQAAFNDCEELAGEAQNLGYTKLSAFISDYGFSIEEGETEEDLLANLTKSDEMLVKFREAIAETQNIDAILAKIDNMLANTNYPGKTELQAAYDKILSYKEGTPKADEDVLAEILGAIEEGNAAIKAYILSQQDSATEKNPADFTVFVNHNWFIKDEFAPTLEDGAWVFPNAENYADGSSNDDFSSEGWTITGTYTGGDQRLNYKFGYPCWNAWGSGINGTIGVGQTIEGLPNGYYTVSAQLITESGYLTDQHVYAESSSEKKISDPLTGERWDEGEWETVSMTAAQKVLVVDGKLTIGAEGTGTGEASAGWFCATNFNLYFLGKASDEVINAAVANALTEKVKEAKAYAETMHFKGDQKALNDTIAKYEVANEKDAMIEAKGIIEAALAEAQNSEAKYFDYLPEDGTVEGKTLRIVEIRLAETDVQTYPSFGAAKEIVQFAYNYVIGWMACDTASYKEFDATVDLLKNYANTYAPAYQEAAELATKAGDAGKAALESVMADQKAKMIAEIQKKEMVDAFVTVLKKAIYDVNKQIIWDADKEATDFTAFIQNPNAEAVDGWTFVMGNGDGNGEKSGQWFDDSATRYFDTYNSGGLNGFMASQVVTGLPNGTYKVSVDARTPAEGAYVFAGTATDTTFVEIPLNYYATITVEGVDTTVVASDKYGPIWEEAKAICESNERYNSLSPEEQAYWDKLYEANSSEGRGWKHMTDFAEVVVTNHELFIGTMTGTEASKTEKVFAGAWYSVGAWKLTLVSKGDNADWMGPITGIETINNNVKMDGIYTMTGIKANKLQRGINIVVRNGKVQKVLVK